MPQTRRSSTTSGSPLVAGSSNSHVSVSRQKTKDTISEEKRKSKDEKLSGSLVVESVGRTRRQVTYNRHAVTEPSGGKIKGQPLDKVSPARVEQKETAEEKRKTTDQIRKRTAETVTKNTGKKTKLTLTEKDSEPTEMVSPRRSSRTVIPNRRYKDIEDVTPPKSRKPGTSAKDKKSVKEKSKFTSGIKLSETESESEDIMTEEIPIDTSQAMDVLASSNTEISIDNSETVEIVADSNKEILVGPAVNANNEEKSVVEDKSDNENAVTSEVDRNSNPEDQSKRADTLDTVSLGQVKEGNEQDDDKHSIYEVSTPPKHGKFHQKIIVVEPGTDKTVSRSLINSAGDKAGQDATLKGKGRFLEIPTSALKLISSGQVVHVPTIKTIDFKRNKCPTQQDVEIGHKQVAENDMVLNANNNQELVHMVETDAEVDMIGKTERNEDAENVIISQTNVCADGPNMKMDAITAVRMEDKPSVKDISDAPAVMATDVVTIQVKASDDYQAILQNKEATSETSGSGLVQTISTALGQTIQIIKAPLEKKSVMPEETSNTDKEKLRGDENEQTISDTVSDDQMMNESEILVQDSTTETIAEYVSTNSLCTDEDLTKSVEAELNTGDKKNEDHAFISIGGDIAEPVTVEVSDKDETKDGELMVNYDTSESNTDNGSQIDNSVKTGLQSSFCEVIEFSKRKTAPPQPGPMQPTFDYIMFGDNLIEIRKPQPLHGRIQLASQEDSEPNTGKVEFVVISESKPSKASTMHGSQDALSTFTKVSQSLGPVKVITPVSSLGQSPKFSAHGHILRSDPTAPATSVVEISDDVFQREMVSENVSVELDKGEALTETITAGFDQEVNIDIGNAQSEEVKTAHRLSSGEETIELISRKSIQTAENSAGLVPTSQPFMRVQQGRTVGSNIVVVGKDYFKDKGLEYEVGPVRPKTVLADTREATIGTADEHVETSQEEISDSHLIHDGSKIIINVSSESDSSVNDGQKLATAGTQTPVMTKTVSENQVIHAELKTVTKTVQGSEKQQTEQFIIVHLPEGTEIKQKEVKTPVNYRQFNETEITMLEDGQFVCVDCHYVTTKRSNWFKHRRKHLGIRPHQCPLCSYQAATSSNLKRHIAIHQDIRDFVCHLCCMAFRQKIHLERHLKYRHEEKKIKCPLCEYTCANENPDLKIHIKRRHMPLPDGSVLPFTCDECGIMTVSKKDLRQHKKFHKKGPELKLFCEFCSFVTDCESRLKRHMYIHTKEKPFQCGLCTYRATQKEHVLRHMKSQHDIEVMKKKKTLLPKKEEKDDEDADSGDSEIEGMDSKNPFEQADYSSMDRIFACNHCTMRFAKLINLYKHLYSQHRSLMPEPGSSDFQCVVCEFRTNNKKNLLVHMRKHNMQDQTPPSHVYSCVLCRYINPRRKNLFQHMKKKHGIEIMVKDDGTTNCLISTDSNPNVLGREEEESNVISLSNIVNTQTLDENALQIVTVDGASNSIQIVTDEKTDASGTVSLENVIGIEDIASYVGNSTAQDLQVVSDVSPNSAATSFPGQTSFTATVAEHEAAEAIEGLQALAEQAGLVETQIIETVDDSEIIAGSIIETGEMITEQAMMSSDSQEVTSQQEMMSVSQQEVMSAPQGETDAGIQLSSDQISQLSSGDFVEIDGEVYKVEISSDTPVLVK